MILSHYARTKKRKQRRLTSVMVPLVVIYSLCLYCLSFNVIYCKGVAHILQKTKSIIINDYSSVLQHSSKFWFYCYTKYLNVLCKFITEFWTSQKFSNCKDVKKDKLNQIV